MIRNDFSISQMGQEHNNNYNSSFPLLGNSVIWYIVTKITHCMHLCPSVADSPPSLVGCLQQKRKDNKIINNEEYPICLVMSLGPGRGSLLEGSEAVWAPLGDSHEETLQHSSSRCLAVDEWHVVLALFCCRG